MTCRFVLAGCASFAGIFVSAQMPASLLVDTMWSDPNWFETR